MDFFTDEKKIILFKEDAYVMVICSENGWNTFNEKLFWIYLMVQSFWWWARSRAACFSKKGWLVGFYDKSTIVGYLLPNPFLYK